MRFNGRPTSDVGALAALVAADTDSGGFLKDSQYSEGDWTPVITFATPGDLAVTYATQVGKYKRIGNLIIASFALQTSAFTHSTASGNLQVTGLPFPEVNTSSIAPTVAMQAWQGITKANFTQMGGTISAGASTISFGMSGSGQNFTAGPNTTEMASGGTIVLRGVAIYYAA